MKLTDIAKNKPILEARKPMSVETAGEENMAQAKAMRPQFTDKQIKMAFGILNDPRYKDGNYDGAHATIEKLAKGLSKHPSVANAMKRANEDIVTEGSYLYLNGKEIDQSTVVYDMQDYSDGMFELHGANYADGTELDEKELEELESTQELIDWVMIDFIEEGRDGDNINDATIPQGKTVFTKSKQSGPTDADTAKLHKLRKMLDKENAQKAGVKMKEGKSPHKKGTAKYKKHMAAMHAEEEYKPHMMYDPKTGEGKMAKVEKDHLDMKDMGWTHDNPKTKKVEEEKRWKQTSMSPEDAIRIWGKKNVQVTPGGLNNGDDMVEVFVESMNEAGGYYTQPVYDMIEQHGIEKVMHELLTALDGDVIQDALSRMNTENEARDTTGVAKIPYVFGKKEFEENEHYNMHTENAMELVRMFGTRNEQERMEMIMKAHNQRGHILGDEMAERDAIVKKYYPMLEGLDEGMMSDMEKDLMMMYSGDGEPGLADAMGMSEKEFAQAYTKAGSDIQKMIKNYVKANEDINVEIPEDMYERIKNYSASLNEAVKDTLMGVEDPVIVITNAQGKIVDKLQMSIAAKKYKFNMTFIRPQFKHQGNVKHGQFTLSAPMAGQPMESTSPPEVINPSKDSSKEDLKAAIKYAEYMMAKMNDTGKASYEKEISQYKSWLDIDEGYSILPDMPSKYVARDGLEGPIMTRSGKVVYYDPKEGKYYDPDTDIYLTYDEWKAFDPELPIKSEAIDAVLAQADGYSVVKDDGDDIHIMYNDEIIGGASFDSGSDSFWVSTGEAGQESFDTAQEIIDYYAQNKITEIASPDEQATHSNVALDTLRKIVADKQNMPVKFADGQMSVDLYSASAITQVFDKINPQNQAKLLGMMGTKAGMIKVTNLVFGMMNKKGDHSVAETEGPVSEYTGDSIGVKEMEQMLVTLADKKVNSIAYQRFISGSDKYKADPALAKELEGDKKKLATDVNESAELDRIKYLSGL